MDDQWPHQTRDTSRLLERVRSEYLEMPGLTLTAAQARRLSSQYGPERFALRANVPAVRRESRDGDAAADCLPDDH